MPFYKWIIETKNRSDLKTLKCSDEIDRTAVANKRMVNVLQHLSQLVKIASEIFDGVDQECRSILKRTDVLRIKIQKCQEVVENLSENPIQYQRRSVVNTIVKDTVRRVSKHLESDNIFSGQGVWESLGRPPAVERLRKHLLPPDGSPASPPVISVEDQKTFSTDMTSQVKLPSNVVPIDVSGQQFSRMSTFRRSLIHVDFFIRRKKKREKRRNTVTECDTKELENVLHNIINESGQHALMSNLGNKEKMAMNTDKNLTDKVSIADKLEEKNNNSEKVFIDHNMDLYFNPDNLEQKQKSCVLQNEDVKLDLNSQKPPSETTKLSSMSRRKSKGHIPISTISAAMSVAVEMRQMNGKIKLDNLQSSGNSSCDNSDNMNEERKGRDVFSDIKNFKRNGLKDVLHESKCYSEAYRDQKEAQISNDKFSTVNVTNKNGYLNTLAEQGVFFLSSDESEGESPEILKNNYGSSLSLSSMSNESLNSLLSQTATEVTSSNITLSSIGIEPFSSSLVSNKIIKNKETLKSLDKVDTSIGNGSLPVTKVDITSHTHKPSKKEKPKKTQKSQKPGKTDTNKNSLEYSKSLFSSLVNKKTKSKDPNKHKSVEIGPSYHQNQPLINMYGCSSPKISKQIPSFIKENVSPLTENPRKCMQSFITYQSFQDKSIEQEHTQVTYEYPNICKTEIRENEEIYPYPPNSIAPEVPLKYSHKVTVTPIARKNMPKANKWRDESLSDNEEVKTHLLEPNADKKLNRLPYYSEKSYAPNSYQSCNHPTYQTGTKLAARVVLDPEGRVIYCTNSLDRKPLTARAGKHSNNTNYHLQTDSANHGEILKGNNPVILTNSMTQNENIIQNSIKKVQENNGFHIDQETKNNGFTQIERYQPSTGHPQTSIYPPTHSFHPYPSVTHNGKKTTSLEFSNKQLNPSVNTSSKNALPSFIGSSSMIHPDPNVSGLPSTDKILRNPTNLHSLQKTTSTSSINNSFRNSCSFSSNDLKTEQSNMSMDDLFAVIHNCKKRLNIKSDSEISLESSSSRSSSSSFRPTPTKGALAETGFLSPRSPTSSFETSRDRRSWADFRPLSCSTPNNRKSLASDRLGPPKPTSMHDFKMLLLQARSNNQANGPRKSAVEMLKVSTAQDKSSVPTPNSPPSRLNSFSMPNSPSDLFIHDGHTTVPFKRNNRARSSLQSRYTMYPPIFEDCSEDYDHTRDNIQSNSLKQYSKADLNDNPKHHSDMNKDNSKTLASNSRNWI